MSFIDRSDDEFERALLHSASCDVPNPEASERAWSRFATLMASIATTHAAPQRLSTAPETAASVGRFAHAASAAKWLVVGAIGGSAATFAFVGRHDPPHAPATLIAPTSIVQAERSAWVAPEPYPSPSVASAPSASRSPGRALARRHGQVTEEHGSPTPGLASAPLGDASSLAAEVAALDVARSALDGGRPDDALTLLRRYLRDFPKGKLVPEAEVMEIEALAAKGDRARVTREATGFLERYPNAPQRTRVEQLRAEAGQK